MIADDFALRFTITLGHALWQITAISLVAWLIVRTIRVSASVCYAVFASALFLSAACLPFNYFLTHQPADAPTITISAVGEASVATPVSGSTAGGVVETGENPRWNSLARAEPIPVTDPSWWRSSAPWIVVFYSIGVGVMLVRLLVAFHTTKKLRTRSEVVSGGIWAETLDRLAGKAKPALAWSGSVAGPVIVGLIKPVILLPVSLANGLTPAQVESILRHELAHLSRYDHWLVLAQRFLETLLFFHPAAWWLSHEMSVAREEACDDLVIAGGMDHADYAEALVRCSEIRDGCMDSKDGRLQLAADGGGKRSQLRTRVLRLVGQNEPDGFRLSRFAWLTTFAIIGLLTVIAAGQIPSQNDRLAAVFKTGTEEEIKRAVERLVEQGPEVAEDMIPLLQSGRTDRPAIKVLTELARDPGVQSLLIEELKTTRSGHYPLLLCLGASGNDEHAEFIAGHYPKSSLGTIFALERILTHRPESKRKSDSKTLDYLLAGFDQVPTEYWHVLAAAIERSDDAEAVPELKRRLAEVDQNAEAFPPATTPAMIRAIRGLSRQTAPTTHSEFVTANQGRILTFSVDPPGTNYIDRSDEEALREKTGGPGFMIKDNQLILLNGLKAAPLWPDGYRPFPGSWQQWLTRRSHRGVLDDLLSWWSSYGNDQIEIPANGLLAATKDDTSLIILVLRKSRETNEWNVSIVTQDPLHLLVKEPEQLPEFTDRHYCDLYDIDSERKDGALSLRHEHLTRLTRELREAPNEPVLTVDFDAGSWKLLVPGSKSFRVVESEAAWDDADAAESVLINGAPVTSMQPKKVYAFATRMPGGEAVAGVMKVTSVAAGESPPRVRLLYKFMSTARALAICDTAPGQKKIAVRSDDYQDILGHWKVTSVKGSRGRFMTLNDQTRPGDILTIASDDSLSIYPNINPKRCTYKSTDDNKGHFDDPDSPPHYAIYRIKDDTLTFLIGDPNDFQVKEGKDITRTSAGTEAKWDWRIVIPNYPKEFNDEPGEGRLWVTLERVPTGEHPGDKLAAAALQSHHDEIKARRSIESSPGQTKAWYRRSLIKLTIALDQAIDPELRKSVALAALGYANSLKEYQQSLLLVHELIRLEQDAFVQAMRLAELGGIHQHLAELESDSAGHLQKADEAFARAIQRIESSEIKNSPRAFRRLIPADIDRGAVAEKQFELTGDTAYRQAAANHYRKGKERLAELKKLSASGKQWKSDSGGHGGSGMTYSSVLENLLFMGCDEEWFVVKEKKVTAGE